MSGAELLEGAPVVFVDRKGRSFYDQLRAGGRSHVRGDMVDHDPAIGQLDGVLVRSAKNRRYLVFSATYVQHALHMQRHAQIVYPKDAAMLVAWADIGPGHRVVEGGFGSGALTTALLRAVGAEGRVYTYELRQESANRAAKNVHAFLGETPNHTVHIGDLYEGIEEQEVDRVVLDVPEPWEVLDTAAARLAPGGVFAAYIPTTVQLQKLGVAIEADRRFACFEALETLLRHWHVSEESVRPKSAMVGHTGFLAFARRRC